METSPSGEGFRVRTVEFNGKNYESWKFSIGIALKSYNLLPIVEGSRTKPNEVIVADLITNQAGIDAWVKYDNLAMHYLFNTCNEEQQHTLLICSTAHAIWSSLTSRYQQNTVERRQVIQQDFYSYKFKPENSVRAHVEAIKLLVQQLNDAGGPTDDESTCNKIITSLPPSYDNFLTSWESSPIAERTLDNLTTRLDREEQRRLRSNGGERSSDDSAFFCLPTNRPPAESPGPSRQGSFSRTDEKPSPYPQIGRGRGRGRRGNRNGRFTAANGSSRNRIGAATHSHDEKDCYHKQSGAERCRHCKIIDHNEKDCYRKPTALAIGHLTDKDQPSHHGESYVASFISSVSRSNTDFFLDSGATQHLSAQRWALKNFRPLTPGSRSICGIGQAKVHVHGTGDAEILTTINGVAKKRVITDLLYAPDIGINLLSIAVITMKGAEVHFTGSQALIFRNGCLEISANRVSNTLYLLDITIVRADATTIARPLKNSLQDWHERLAHISHRIIIKMAASGAVEGLDLPSGSQPPTERCHDCATGKMTRITFKPSTNGQATRIGALIHSDVCGPMQVPSIGGALYYVLFHDDCSSFRRVLFIKHKSKVTECFKEFVSHLHAQTGQLTAILRSDNGGEYESTDFQAWLRKRGIRHETSVRLTPQQNGVAERDNRTLVEGARTLLHANKSLPLTEAGDVSRQRQRQRQLAAWSTP